MARLRSAKKAQQALQSVNWWIWFQAFLFGNDGPNLGFFDNAVDFVAGIFGLYVITSAAGMSPSVAMAIRVSIMIGFVFLVVGSVFNFREILAPKRLPLLCLVGVSLAELLLLVALKQYWSAGKGFSFVAYFLALGNGALTLCRRSQDRGAIGSNREPASQGCFLSVVAPVYKEEGSIAEFLHWVTGILQNPRGRLRNYFLLGSLVRIRQKLSYATIAKNMRVLSF